MPSLRPRPFAAAAGAIVALSAAAGLAAPPGLPAEEVARALSDLQRRGAIDDRTAADLARRAGLPPSAGDLPPGRCGTASLRLIRAWAAGEGVAIRRAPPPPSAGFVESQRYPGLLRVYYARADQTAIAQAALTAAENAWARQIDALGYNAPYTEDDGAGPVVGQFLYLVDTQSWAGLTEPVGDVPQTPLCDCSSRIHLNAQLPLASLAATVEHELNHATQAATDCAETVTAWEGFATAVENFAFPNGTWDLGHVAEFQAYPEYPLDYWTWRSSSIGPNSSYQYGAFLWPRFLEERFGVRDGRFLREVWSSFAQQGTVSIGATTGIVSCSAGNAPDWFQGLDALLQSKGSSLAAAFTEFSAWRAMVGAWKDESRFEQAGRYPEPKLAGSHARLPATAYLLAREYGTRYVEWRPPDGGTPGPLRARLYGDAPASWSGSLVAWTADGGTEQIELQAGAPGELQATVPTEGLRRVVLVASQLQDSAHRTDDYDWDTERSLRYVLDRAPPDAGAPDAGPPDAAGTPDARAPDPSDASDASDASDKEQGCGCGAAGGSGLLLGLLALTGLRRGRA